jgi:hypothetical protein
VGFFVSFLPTKKEREKSISAQAAWPRIHNGPAFPGLKNMPPHFSIQTAFEPHGMRCLMWILLENVSIKEKLRKR